MPFTPGMTGTVEISPTVLAALNGAFDLSVKADDIVSKLAIRQFASDQNQRTFSFAKVLQIDSSVSALLDEYEDPNSTPLSGSTSTITALEYGRVVTPTALADAISGGALSRIAAARVGQDAAKWQNLLAINTLAAGTNALFAGTAGTEAGLAAGDVMTPTLLNIAYARLSIAGATKDGLGMYRAILHPAQVHDLRNGTAAGSWNDLNKYTRPEEVIRGEIGSFNGFRIIESSLLAPADQTGAGTVDVYKAIFFGADALGQGVTVPISLRMTFTDKLNRFAHMGWYGVQVMAIPAQEQVYVINTSSSLGVNA